MSKTVPLAQYLFTRLRQLNCKSIHGVPGDFFLRALDYTRPAGVKWIGNANELCAGYAADGYARAGQQIAARRSRGPRVGALLTTYGVGELSAINAVAGSYAERIPVVHLVGSPSRKGWRESSATRPIHHTPGDGRMEVWAAMAKEITCAQTNFHKFSDANEAVQSYDETLVQCVRQSRPVYASIPSDMMEAPVAAEILQKPLSGLRDDHAGFSSDDPAQELTREIAQKIISAKCPLLIADGMCYPFNFIEEANALVEAGRIPAMAFMSGKGVIEEQSPYWLGTLSGPNDYAAAADLVVTLGPVMSDVNTAAWTAIPQCRNTIMFNSDSVEVDGIEHSFVDGGEYDSRTFSVKQILQTVIAKLRDPPWPSARSAVPASSTTTTTVPNATPTDLISQDTFWPKMSSYLQSHDTILLANGTPLLGGRSLRLPAQTQVVASSIWCSIGSMLPCAQGVALAKRDHDLPGRTVLFEGDGSFQVTCQALSDIIGQKLDVTVFLVNNQGYTYERWLNGMDEQYNCVAPWRYGDAARFFGARTDDLASGHSGQAEVGNASGGQYPVLDYGRKVETAEELEALLQDDKVRDGRGLKSIEVVMAPQDVPQGSKAGLLRASEALRGSKQHQQKEGN